MAEPITTTVIVGGTVVAAKAYLATHGIHIAIHIITSMVMSYIMDGRKKAIKAGVAGGLSYEVAEKAVDLLSNFI